jgi:type VI secretion system ImpC/EvpB family protein
MSHASWDETSAGLHPRSPSQVEARQAPAPGLLDVLVESVQNTTPAPLLSGLLAAKSTSEVLALLGQHQPALVRDATPRRIAGVLGRLIAGLDAAISGQVNAILHHPRFQQLEASWRSLWYLVRQADEARELAEQDGNQANIKVRLLNVSKRELYKDVEGVVEFDQSQVFRKVYEDEFGTPGGEPYGLLIGDYQFTNHPDDLELLARLSDVAAAAFAPLVTAPAPELLGLDDFGMLEQPHNLAATFNQLEYLKWRWLREREESRFLGLVLPSVLARLPHEDDGSRIDGFRFHEDVEGPDRSRYLWGNAAYCFGAVVLKAFAASGWFAEIRGAHPRQQGGGVVTGLPVHYFSTDRRGVAPKISTEVAVTDEQESQLASLGFIPLCHASDTELSVFSTNQSVEKPKAYDDPTATANARISAMLQYTLCASRFAHYLKVLARSKLGSFVSEQELETFLNRWLNDYVAADEKAPLATKAKFPLREASVQVREVAGQPGSYNIVIHLLPHFQLDALTASLKLVTKLAPARPT